MINKCDINEEMSQEIEVYCKNKYTVIAKIPYNDIFNTAMIQKLAVSEVKEAYTDVQAIQENIKEIAEAIKSFLKI